MRTAERAVRTPKCTFVGINALIGYTDNGKQKEELGTGFGRRNVNIQTR